MRRRAAFYLLLGLTTALLIVALATGLQTGGSADPRVWLWAQRHVPLLQMLDLASLFLFVVIGLYGLTVSRLQVQLQHQAEDFGDQMQTLLHRNDELAKVNEEYAEQIAALEGEKEEPPALSMGDSGQRVIAALHWQVDAQARQLDAVHQALEHQHNALQELQQHVHALAANPAAPSLSENASSPRLADASPPAPASEEEPETIAAEGHLGSMDWTGNDGSTLVGETLDFDVSAFVTAAGSPPNRPQAVTAVEARTYPVGASLLAVAAGHLSSMPDTAPVSPSAPERVEIAVGKDPAVRAPSGSAAEESELPPVRTQGALALDLAESALSSLQSETQEALSALRAQVEATNPQERAPSIPAAEPEKSSNAGRRKPWRMRF